MKKTALYCLFLVCVISTSLHAQEAPPPRRMPRVSVSREMLAESHDAMPSSREVQGSATVIDGERLRVGETDLRLFGIVPPQMSASFGPQARAALDALANGQNVNCQIRDRDRDGRLLATCHNGNSYDLALELLKRGLAVTARGSIAGSELATTYLAAEQAAQNQKIGLWSMAATPASVAAAATPVAAPPAESEVRKDDKPASHTDAQTQAKITADVLSQQAQASRSDDSTWAQNDEVGFFERYQILIAGLLMATTAFGIITALWTQKNRDRREEIRATAAALRGELMAARAVCMGRANSITDEEQDHLATWPRIRTTLYQAYVGRLGLLGAELARQVAATYGQSSDYAALYNAPGSTYDAPKKQALEMLAKHIDQILPRLAEIEATGRTPRLLGVQQATVATPSLPRAVIAPNTKPMEVKPKPPATTVKSSAAMGPNVLWESVRSYIQNHRNAIVQEQPESIDPHVAEYAAMIEADMARYRYSEQTASLNMSQHKKSS